MQMVLPSAHFEAPPGGLYLRRNARHNAVGAVEARARVWGSTGDLTTAQPGIADVALTLTYGNPGGKKR
jgi:hypothetical protein